MTRDRSCALALALACVLLAACRRQEPPPRPPARTHFTAETCPEAKLAAVRKPGFGTLSQTRYEAGEGERKVDARFGPPAEAVPCRASESDDACASRVRDAYAAREDVKAALAMVRGTTHVAADVDAGAPAARTAHPYVALATTIFDEPRLTMLLTTTADEAAVDGWARDVQSGGGIAVSAQETSAGHFALRIRCR